MFRLQSFNLRREAAPHATRNRPGDTMLCTEFQSQTRSRSTCDNALCRLWRVIATFQSQTRSRSTCDDGKPAYYWVPCCRFNLRREAAPHATHTDVNNALTFAAVSISDEKPL